MKTQFNQLTIFTLLFSLTFGIQSCNTTQKGKQDNVQDVIRKINEQYQDAYNTKNEVAIKALYTKEATRVSPNGHIDNGNEEIRAAFERVFSRNDSTTRIKITIESINNQPDGVRIVKGRYDVKGNKIESNLPFELEGPYINTFVKENGEWKISKTEYTADLNIND